MRVEVRRLYKNQVLAKFGWTDADFEAAQAFSFPIAGKRPRFLKMGIDLVWKEDALDRWASEQREKAEAIPRLVGAGA